MAAIAGIEQSRTKMEPVLALWMENYNADRDGFASKAVFVEMRLRQALSASPSLGVPNIYRCALVCDAFERVAPLTGRFEGLLGLLWQELQKCIFADAPATAADAPVGARGFSRRRPFFAEVGRLQQSEAEMQARMQVVSRQKDSTLSEIDERHKSINHTLSTWNRALVLTGSKEKADKLQRQIGELGTQLVTANEEIARMAEASFADPYARLLKLFDESLAPLQQQEALAELLRSDAAARILPSVPKGEALAHLQHLCQARAPASTAAHPARGCPRTPNRPPPRAEPVDGARARHLRRPRQAAAARAPPAHHRGAAARQREHQRVRADDGQRAGHGHRPRICARRHGLRRRARREREAAARARARRRRRAGRRERGARAGEGGAGGRGARGGRRA